MSDMIKDAEKITRENSACIVVQDIKGTEDTGADIKKKDRKFAINGYKMNAKKVWLLIYSILGIVVMVVKANKNTKKFHYSWCNSVNDMKGSNKKGYNERSSVIDAGYVPCKKCKP